MTGRRIARRRPSVRQAPPLACLQIKNSKVRVHPLRTTRSGCKKQLFASRQELGPAAGDETFLGFDGILQLLRFASRGSDSPEAAKVCALKYDRVINRPGCAPSK